MEDIDQIDHESDAIPDDDDLLMREVVQGDSDLLFLHHYLSEVYRKG